MKTILALVAYSLFFYLWQKRATLQASIPFSFLPLPFKRKSFKYTIAGLGNISFALALFLLFLAFTGPFPSFISADNSLNQLTSKKPARQSGIGIYLVIDKSSSMTGQAPILQAANGGLTKIGWVKQIAEELVRKRGNDAIGLVTFARSASILSPLTIDDKALISQIKAIAPVGSEREDGTAIGYALYKTANLIVSANYFTERQKERKKPAYQMKNEVIVILTDGLQSPHPDDRSNPYRFIPLDDALSFAIDRGIKVFYVAVDNALKNLQFSNEIKKLKSSISKTGGAFIFLDQDKSLLELFTSIEKLTPQGDIDREIDSPVTNEHSNQDPLTRYILFTALAFFTFGILSETVFARTLP